MNKFKRSQVVMLFLLAVLLIITPLLSSSLRPTYLYFIINILIIALGAEAGLLSSFSKPSEDRKQTVLAAPKPLASSEVSPDNGVVRTTNIDKVVAPASTEKKAKVVEKSASEKFVGSVKIDKVTKCPSMPSLFFIGGGESEAEDVAEEAYAEEEVKGEEKDGEEEVSGQELFTKAETFIGNFYKQLKMQREDSWKRIHGFSQKAF
ncbi:hypothetical protein CFP56_039784 [Quercus suber]|uniref:DUF4408 domain-containing protein n=1 Tax=Quercus suber TaxID=58331 RepID=A0AAW0MAV8_QUESU